MTEQRTPRPGLRTGIPAREVASATTRQAAQERAHAAAMARERAGAVPAPRRVGDRDLPPVPPSRVAAARKPRPDPGPLRLAIGLTGIATASALVSAFLSPSAGVAAGGAAAAASDGTTAAATDATESVRHITRYVQLQPGQTPPTNAVVKPAPTPKPRVVVVRTRQSGG